MLPRLDGDGGRAARNPRLLLALAVFLLPWVRLVEAQQNRPIAHPIVGQAPLDHDEAGSAHIRPDHDRVHGWAATPIEAGRPSRQTADHLQSPPKRLQHANKRNDPVGANPLVDENRNKKRRGNHDYQNPEDASALATLAPAQAVRAPRSPRHHRSSSAPASGLASPQIARSLGDWEVEDFVLLATVDGDLYASDRNTGKEIWRLEVEQPMIETKQYRTNISTLDEDYDPVDHYIWAVEPNRDGGLYVWIPDAGMGLVRTGFTMKRLVEDLAPYAGESPPVVYTGDKKTTMITLDAATGQVLKWFGSGGSHVDEAESCLRPDALHGMAASECSSTGTITLGRIEYTVAIHRRDHRPIATLKYSEWVPNNFDNDLFQQYQSTLDGRYISSKHDGKIYAFDFARNTEGAKMFSEKFSSPVARVFDVCRPWDAPRDSNPELVILPQPPMPAHKNDEEMAHVRSNSIFLNQTENGDWFAMSGRSYPLVVDAPVARITKVDWTELAPIWDTISQSQVSKALVGTHYLDTRQPGATMPPRSLPASEVYDTPEDPENDSALPAIVDQDDSDVTIIDKFKEIPQKAANSALDFVSNPILIILAIGTLIYHQKTLRHAYSRFRRARSWKDVVPYVMDGVASKDEKSDTDAVEPKPDETADKATVAPLATTKEAPKDEQAVSEPQSQQDDIPTNAPISTGKADEEIKSSSPANESQSPAGSKESSPSPQDGLPTEKKKKAHRGRRGGVKHKKGKGRETSVSRDDEPVPATVEEAVNNAKKLGDLPTFEPDVHTVANDMQAVTGPIIRMGNIEVNMDEQLGSGSNGTLVFAGKFDGRDVAVKRMLIQFYDIASQETRLLRESDDHPNGTRSYAFYFSF